MTFKHDRGSLTLCLRGRVTARRAQYRIRSAHPHAHQRSFFHPWVFHLCPANVMTRRVNQQPPRAIGDNSKSKILLMTHNDTDSLWGNFEYSQSMLWVAMLYAAAPQNSLLRCFLGLEFRRRMIVCLSGHRQGDYGYVRPSWTRWMWPAPAQPPSAAATSAIRQLRNTAHMTAAV
jgi:hypothetical protein